jgi:hypothetical protein
MKPSPCLALIVSFLVSTIPFSVDAADEWSGIYPHLAFFNNEGECGTGAVVPWAGKLWALTYAPHMPKGSSDKLYEISPALVLTVRPESIGGTPANRMIHRESGQLFMGPYAIDEKGAVRVIPYTEMFGRPTANARHLTDPAGKIYCASMEEALYEIDVKTLDVTTLYRDEQDKSAGPKADLPGYHGKGMFSGQGVLVYANNGEHSPEARRDPFVPSGVLAEWNGKDWQVVRRTQFTEVTGPGGIFGNENPATDPLWSMGWDAKSLILMLRDGGGLAIGDKRRREVSLDLHELRGTRLPRLLAGRDRAEERFARVPRRANDLTDRHLARCDAAGSVEHCPVDPPDRGGLVAQIPAR